MQINYNQYNDAIVTNVTAIQEAADLLERMRQEGRTAIWLRLDIEHSDMIAGLRQLGYELHHCDAQSFMLTAWLLDNDVNRLPSYATHIVRVEAVVFRMINGVKHVLLVREQFGHADRGYKLPSGNVDLNEFISDAAVREVQEETGIRTRFVGVLGCGNRLNARFRCSEMFFVVHLEEDGEADAPFDIQLEEIESARWVALPYVRHVGSLEMSCLQTAHNQHSMHTFYPRKRKHIIQGFHV
jgi:ADP-ribose pyrophosphatase YjhB (NUDIX family)